MKKVFIRSLWWCDPWMWGTNESHQILIRDYLNNLGFYVLTKDRYTLDVYALRDKTFYERWVV
jgi:IS30 family transposase